MNEKDMAEGRAIVALVRDLMFASRVRGSAPGAAVARNREALLELVGPETRLVIVELEAPESVQALEDLRSRGVGGRLVAFGPHVMEDRLAAAREAGAEVLTRGAFVKGLSALVAEVEGG